MVVIDLHCHVLPGVDRGPADLEESVAMVQALRRQGVRTAVAAPRLDGRGIAAYELAGRIAEVQHAVTRAGCAVTIVSGAELTLEWASRATAVELRRASLGGRGTDLLVSVPHGPLPLGFEDGVEDLMRGGFRVVLAHPAASATFQRTPERLRRLVERGALVQVTARALLRGPDAAPSTALARRLVADGIAHVLATEAYSAALVAGSGHAPRRARGGAARRRSRRVDGHRRAGGDPRRRAAAAGAAAASQLARPGPARARARGRLISSSGRGSAGAGRRS